MSEERVTLRIAKEDLDLVDLLVDAGEFPTRSEVIRQAIKDFAISRASKVRERLEARKQLQSSALELKNLKAEIEERQAMLEKLMRK